MQINPLSSYQAIQEINDFSASHEVENKLDSLENAHKEVASRIEKTEQTNKTVDSTINSDKEKYKNENIKDLQKMFVEQLRSPFPTLATEVRLEALRF